MHSSQRSAARVAAVLVPVLVVLGTAGPASAEPPSTWENTDSLSGIDVLLIYGGIPLLLFVVIAVFGALTHTSKAHSYPIRREHDGGLALSVGPRGDATEKALPADDTDGPVS